jgi:hypothetical protein
MSHFTFSLAYSFARSTGIPAIAISLDESPGVHRLNPDFYGMHMVRHFSHGCFNCVLRRAVSQHLRIIPSCHIGRRRPFWNTASMGFKRKLLPTGLCSTLTRTSAISGSQRYRKSHLATDENAHEGQR